MKVLGVSGSPIKNSNSDRALQAVLDAIGLESEFIKLSDYTVGPCNACLGCVTTNRCVIKDDGNTLCDKVKEADVLVVSGFTPYSTLDSRTKAFMERLYPLRHNNGYLAGKLGAAVITSCVTAPSEMLPPAAQLGANAIHYFMMEEGMNFVGSLLVHGNVPCVKCGNGDVCQMSGLKMLYGAEATVDSVGIHAFENQLEIIQQAKDLGKKLRESLVF
ncbi:flavodoxin family protein (plasmid) [Sulfurospirillum sp. 'SP']|nr:flavodoxin family protein [Sulfurospirillum sp. 'SP']WNZ00312.1 flavodoxin family protein [Sulfurospirillum sp. 'SP']WNZ00365.1 flavodoxin family protein [Sulfurospirillum sp. 'SP']